MLPTTCQVSKKTSLGHFHVLVEKKNSLSAVPVPKAERRLKIIWPAALNSHSDGTRMA